MLGSHTQDDIITLQHCSLQHCTLLIKVNKILLAIFQTCGKCLTKYINVISNDSCVGVGTIVWYNTNGGQITFHLLSLCSLAVGNFSFISVSLSSWQHYLCGGAVGFNQGMLSNTWDNISTIYGYFSL